MSQLYRTVFLLCPTALEDGGLGEDVLMHARQWPPKARRHRRKSALFDCRQHLASSC
jgi:hypothetical protein